MTPDLHDWTQDLAAFSQERRAPRPPLPDGHMLAALPYEQRRVTGGVLLQFLTFIMTRDAFDLYPSLTARPIEDRLFLFLTDVPGAVAFQEIVDASHGRTMWLDQHDWRAWLESPGRWPDDDFELHYECWSAWHQNVDPLWPAPEGPYHELWVHEEGHAVGDREGRGAQHLWDWDGTNLRLLTPKITSWTSEP